MADISSIRNLGPAVEKALNDAGVMTAEDLHALGADAAYARLLENGGKPHFIGYYVLHMALQGRPWNDCKGEEKKALRKTFDALKSAKFDSGRSELEEMLILHLPTAYPTIAVRAGQQRQHVANLLSAFPSRGASRPNLSLHQRLRRYQKLTAPGVLAALALPR